MPLRRPMSLSEARITLAVEFSAPAVMPSTTPSPTSPAPTAKGPRAPRGPGHRLRLPWPGAPGRVSPSRRGGANSDGQYFRVGRYLRRSLGALFEFLARSNQNRDAVVFLSLFRAPWIVRSSRASGRTTRRGSDFAWARMSSSTLMARRLLIRKCAGARPGRPPAR